MVEFALVLPVLLLILLAILKFGLLFENYLTLTDATRAGARTLAISRGVAVSGATYPGGTGPCQNAEAQVKSSAGSLNQATIMASANHFQTGALDSCTTGVLVSGDPGTVIATYPFSINILGISFYSGSLTVSATERIE